MQPEVRSCQSCKEDFRIEPEDFDFYTKIDVPPPTFCPDCRNLRRMAWREEKSFYKATCKLCGKSVISIHSPDWPFIIYCRDCYFSDQWDPLEYGRPYDFSKPFFAQYRELMEAVPRPAMTGTSLISSDFTHASNSLRNCYNVYWSFFAEDSEHASVLLMTKKACDGYVVDNSDTVYESIHSNRLYKVRFGYFADDCMDSAFIFDCVGLSDCFGCINLRKKKYCLWNEQLSKEEYKERIKYWDLGSYARLTEAKKKFRELYLAEPHRFAHVLSSKDVTGDIIRDTKDCRVCFSALNGVEHCRYMYVGGLGLKDSWDVSGGGNVSELLYEVMALTNNSSRCFFSSGGNTSSDIFYSDWLVGSENMFGCISVKNKSYCILNKQYSREEYGELLPMIKKHMNEMPYVDKRGRVHKFGEFFPTEISAFPFNQSFAFPWYRKTKEEVLDEGWRWQEDAKRDYGITILPEDLPDHIKDASDSILAEVIGCAHRGRCNEQCTTAFRIIPSELALYQELNVALPRLCPNCRSAERLGWRNGFRLYDRACMCGRDGHGHGSSCSERFQTTFSQDRPETVYCDKCYKAEYLA